nr:DNA-binding protein [Bacilli bacterium]
VKERQYIDARANQHEGMVSLMVQQGVQAVLAGGIGAHAVERLEAAGIRLLAGVRLPIDEAIQGLLAGTLEPGDTSCGCGGDHHGEGHHSHGHHHGEHHHQPQ